MIQKPREAQSEYEQFAGVRYVIDPDVLAKQGRSMEAMLLSRRSSSQRQRLETMDKLPSLQEQLKEIAKEDALEPGFLDSAMPLMELAFRLLLRNGNRPMLLNDLHWALTEDWAKPTHPMAIGVAQLKKVLDRGRHYGFIQVDESKARAKK